MYISVLRFYPEDIANIINDFQKKKRGMEKNFQSHQKVTLERK